MESYDVAASAYSSISSVVSFIVAILVIVAMWKIFTKAGEAGWKSVIPIYDLYIEFKLFWGNGWFFLLTLIPIVDIVIMIMLYHKMSKAFGHGVGFTLGLIFFPYIFLLILAFGGDQYQGPQ